MSQRLGKVWTGSGGWNPRGAPGRRTSQQELWEGRSLRLLQNLQREAGPGETAGQGAMAELNSGPHSSSASESTPSHPKDHHIEYLVILSRWGDH